MRFSIIQAIYHKEMLDMLRDRRTMISMVVVPLVVFPLLIASGHASHCPDGRTLPDRGEIDGNRRARFYSFADPGGTRTNRLAAFRKGRSEIRR